MRAKILIIIAFSSGSLGLNAQTINYADGAELTMNGNKATYTDPKGTTSVCVIIKKRIKCSEFSKVSGINGELAFAKVNGRLVAALRKMLRNNEP